MNQQKPQEFPTNKQMFNWILILVSACSMSVKLFLRRAMGPKLMAVHGAWAVILVLFVTGYSKDQGMFYYLVTMMFFLPLQTITTANLKRRGMKIHTRSDGYPALAMKFTRDIRFAKGVVEPLLCVLAGIGLVYVGDAHHMPGFLSVGGWVALAGLCTGIEQAVVDAIWKKRLDDAEDAYMEHQAFTEELRERMK